VLRSCPLAIGFNVETVQVSVVSHTSAYQYH